MKHIPLALALLAATPALAQQPPDAAPTRRSIMVPMDVMQRIVDMARAAAEADRASAQNRLDLLGGLVGQIAVPPPVGAQPSANPAPIPAAKP